MAAGEVALATPLCRADTQKLPPTWTGAFDDLAQNAATLKAITFSGSLFVAGGSDATGEPQVWTSADATSWTRTIVGESAAPGASVNVIVGDGAERLIAFGVGPAGEVIIWAGRISTAAK